MLIFTRHLCLFLGFQFLGEVDHSLLDPASFLQLSFLDELHGRFNELIVLGVRLFGHGDPLVTLE